MTTGQVARTTAQRGSTSFVFTPDAVPPLPVFCSRILSPLIQSSSLTSRVASFTAQAVVSKGRVYASGSIGCDKELKLVEGGVQAQTVGESLNMSKFGLMCCF